MSNAPRHLSYMRNKHFGFEEAENGDFKITTSVEDTYLSTKLVLTVRFPGWEILSVSGRMKRTFNRECPQAVQLLQSLVGVRIGAGLTKKVDGLIGGAKGCTNLANIVLETCHTTIEGMHSHMDRQTAAKSLDLADHRRLMLQQFPYLKHQCIRWSNASASTGASQTKGAPQELVLEPFCHLNGEAGPLTYSRSKLTGVGQSDEKTFWVQSNLHTAAHDFSVEMQVRLPDFEIVSVQGGMGRSPGGEGCQLAIPFLQNAVGVKIGPGLTATIDEKVGRPGCPRLANLVLENCHAVLQGTIGSVLEDYQKHCQTPSLDELRKRWLEGMPMMRNSCLAYSDESELIRRLGVKWK
jgi:hypothetical protein